MAFTYKKSFITFTSEGIDGQWSTFELRVGTPAQNLRVLPGTSSTQTIVVLEQGCRNLDVADCPNSRGSLFNVTASTTWKQIQSGLFMLGVENALGYTDIGKFGHDTGKVTMGQFSRSSLIELVGLGYLGSGGPVVNNSVVAGVNGTEFYLGVLGLNPRPTNFTTQNDPQPSFLQILKNQSSIPSLSYSYTAGAPYRLNRALGSLILGGYDASSFQASGSSYKFFSDQSLDLTIGLQSITTNTTSGDVMLHDGLISMFIDSSVADIYLPLPACQEFEKAFNLTWNSTTNLYLIDDALHAHLSNANPTVTFTITTPITGGHSFNVTFPYASFDLKATPPLVKQATRYFPLKRATNDTQYILGRTFLQESYLIVDYERGNFSVHPKVWNASAVSDIIAILPPGSEEPKGKALGDGAIAGIVIGVLIFIAAIATAILRYLVLQRRQKALQSESEETKAELPAVSDSEGIQNSKSPDPTLSELGSALRSELGSPATDVKSELESEVAVRSELGPEGVMRSELASPAPLSELLSSEIYEMQGSDVPELDEGGRRDGVSASSVVHKEK